MQVKDIRHVGDHEILITWGDDSRTLFAAAFLQLACRCAQCVDELTGEQRITPEAIDPDVMVREVVPVGGYGVKFRFSTGCNSGIYSFEYLYAIRPKK